MYAPFSFVLEMPKKAIIFLRNFMEECSSPATFTDLNPNIQRSVPLQSEAVLTEFIKSEVLKRNTKRLQVRVSSTRSAILSEKLPIHDGAPIISEY
jgi:hypothetical protein